MITILYYPLSLLDNICFIVTDLWRDNISREKRNSYMFPPKKQKTHPNTEKVIMVILSSNCITMICQIETHRQKYVIKNI